MTTPGYFNTLVERFGNGWNRFWFLRSDPINVCVLRILVGLLALWYQLSFTSDLIQWFASDGLLPSKAVSDAIQATDVPLGNWSYWSYLNFAQQPAELWIAHGLGTVVLVLLTLGFSTRITSILSLVVVLSYLHRTPFMVGQMEPVLAMALFYLCLAPSGACLSLDAIRNRRREQGAAVGPIGVRSSTGANLAVRLIQVHVAALYFFIVTSQLASAGIGDQGEVYRPWWNGNAVWWLIAHADSRLVDLTFLRSLPLVVFAMTHGIVLFEIAYPILIWNNLARPLLIGISVVVWLFLALVTGLLGYCALMIALNVAFIPPLTLRQWVDKGCRRNTKDPNLSSG